MKKSKINESQDEQKVLAEIIEQLELISSVNASSYSRYSFNKKCEAEHKVKTLLTTHPTIATIIARDHQALISEGSVIAALIAADPACADKLLNQEGNRKKLYSTDDVIEILKSRADMQATLFSDLNLAFLSEYGTKNFDYILKVMVAIPGSANYLLPRKDVRKTIVVLRELTAVINVAPLSAAALLSDQQFLAMVMDNIDQVKSHSWDSSEYHLKNLADFMRACNSSNVICPYAYEISELIFAAVKNTDKLNFKDRYQREKYLSYVDAAGKTFFVSRCPKAAHALFPDEHFPKKSNKKKYQVSFDDKACSSTLFNWRRSRAQYQAHCLLSCAYQTTAPHDYDALAEYLRSHADASAIFSRPESQALINNYGLFILIITAAPNVATELFANADVRKQVGSLEKLIQFVERFPALAEHLFAYADIQEIIMSEVQKGQQLLSKAKPCEVLFTVWPKVKSFIVTCRSVGVTPPNQSSLQEFSDDFENAMTPILEGIDNSNKQLMALIKKHPTPEKVHRLLQHTYINEQLAMLNDLTEILKTCPGYGKQLLALPKVDSIIEKAVAQLNSLVTEGDIYRAVGFALKDIAQFAEVSLQTTESLPHYKVIHDAMLDCIRATDVIMLDIPELRDTIIQAANMIRVSKLSNECAPLLAKILRTEMCDATPVLTHSIR